MDDKRYRDTLKKAIGFILVIGTVTFLPVLFLPTNLMFYGFLGWYLILCLAVAISPSIVDSKNE